MPKNWNAIWLSVYTTFCLYDSLFLWISVCTTFCLYDFLSVWLCVWLTDCLSDYLCLTFCLSDFLCVWLSVYLNPCLSVRQSLTDSLQSLGIGLTSTPPAVLGQSTISAWPPRHLPWRHTSTPPMVLGLSSVHDLGLTTPPLAAPLHTSRGVRALHDLSLLTPSSVDNNPPTTSPRLPPWPVDTSRSGQEPRPPKSEPPPVCWLPSVSPHHTQVHYTRFSQLSNTHIERNLHNINFMAPLLWQLAPYACCKDNMRCQGVLKCSSDHREANKTIFGFGKKIQCFLVKK